MPSGPYRAQSFAAAFKCKRTTFTPSLPRFLPHTLCHSPPLSVSIPLLLSLLITLSHPFFSLCLHSLSRPESVPLSLSPYSLSPPLPLSTFKNSTSHSVFTRLLSCLLASVCSSTPSLCSSLHPSFTFSLLIPPCKGFPPSTYISAAVAHAFSFPAISSLFFSHSSPSSPLSLPSFLLPLSCLSAHTPSQQHLLSACRSSLLSPVSHHPSLCQALTL